MKNNIKQVLKNRPQISLPELLQEYPAEKGVAEIVAYMDIASKNEKRHSVSADEQDEILIRNLQTGQIFKVKIPQIIFSK